MQAHTKRPRRELGMMVSGGGFIIPDVIRDKLIKWETHVPLIYLTDNFCTSQPSTQSSLSDLLAVVDGQVMTKSKSLSPVGELEMSFDEWYQAWQRLLKIINQHHPDKFDLWRTHFTSIMLKETCAEDWPLWLAYDTEVRRRSVTTALDPSHFQKRLFNDLYVRYSSTKILMQVQAATNPGPSSHSPSSSHHQPYQRAPTTVTPPDFAVIPFAHIAPTPRKWPRADASSVADRTTPRRPVSPLPWSMGNHCYSRDLPLRTSHAPIAVAANTASVGTERTATAPSTNVLGNTPAHSAATKFTTPKHAPPSSDFLIIITPFIADAWERELLSLGLLDTFSDVPYSIRPPVYATFLYQYMAIPKHTSYIHSGTCPPPKKKRFRRSAGLDQLTNMILGVSG
jgi:hypothetical protein